MARGHILALPTNNKHKQYARYAEHCLQLVPGIPDQEYRAVQREMAAEWLKLADEVLRSSKRQQTPPKRQQTQMS
jgi:DNA primase